MKRLIMLVLAGIVSASCNTNVSTPTLGTAKNNKLTNKDKYNFSTKTFYEYSDEDGNYIANGYGFRPDPMNCNETYYLDFGNTQDEQISIYLNGSLIIKKVTGNIITNDLYLNDYLSNGQNTIRYEIFNKTGDYSWKVSLTKKDYDSSTSFVETKYLIDDIFNNNGDSSKQNQIVKTGFVTFNVCEVKKNTVDFCSTTIDDKGQEHENCIRCGEGYEIKFDDDGQAVGCKIKGQEEYTKTPFGLKYEPNGVDGLNKTGLYTGSCN